MSNNTVDPAQKQAEVIPENEPTAAGSTKPDKNNHDDEYYLSTAPMPRAITHLCVPMMIAMCTGMVYNVINAWFIGRTGDATLLAAITYGLPLTSLIMAIGGVFGVGGGTLISRTLGAGKRSQVRNLIYMITAWSIAVGAAIGFPGAALANPVAWILGADDTAHAATAEYARHLLLFMPVLSLSFALDQVVRALGAARQSMMAMIASTIANFLFDIVLIQMWHWGVSGAAVAVGLANVVTVAYLIAVLRSRGVWPSGRLPYTWTQLRQMLTVGSSELLQSSFMLVTSILFNYAAASFGDKVVAAFGIALRVTQVPEFMAMAISMGALPLLAYCFGAGNTMRLSRAVRALLLVTTAAVVPGCAVAWVLAQPLVHAFSSDPQVLAVGIRVMQFMLLTAVLNAFTALATAYFQATGRAIPAGISGAAPGILYIPFVLVLPHLWGLNGLMWAMPLAEGITFLAVCVMLKWQRR